MCSKRGSQSGLCAPPVQPRAPALCISLIHDQNLVNEWLLLFPGFTSETPIFSDHQG